MAELPLEAWHDFYLSTGATAAAILGATFIVATLTANVEKRDVGLKGFITPTAVHLGSVLVMSAILMMPSLKAFEMIAVFFVGGIAGLIYAFIIWRRVFAMGVDTIDRFWYALMPVVCYGALTVAAILVWREIDFAYELIGFATIALMVIGIRNAWDMATFLIAKGDVKLP